MTIIRVCAGYANAKGNIIPCGQILGTREGPDGVSHGYCGRCYKEALKAVGDYQGGGGSVSD